MFEGVVKVRTVDPMIDEEFISDLIDYIGFIGYEITEKDTRMLGLQIDKACDLMKIRTHQIIIPTALRQSIIEMAAGGFLHTKARSEGFPPDFNFPRAVKSISEGDDRIEFESSSTPEAEFMHFAEIMARGERDTTWKHFRKMSW